MPGGSLSGPVVPLPAAQRHSSRHLRKPCLFLGPQMPFRGPCRHQLRPPGDPSVLTRVPSHTPRPPPSALPSPHAASPESAQAVSQRPFNTKTQEKEAVREM